MIRSKSKSLGTLAEVLQRVSEISRLRARISGAMEARKIRTSRAETSGDGRLSSSALAEDVVGEMTRVRRSHSRNGCGS